MKAIVCKKYGLPAVLQLEEIEKPIPAENEVLVKVHAASVNYNNLMSMKGKPLIGRFWVGLFKPKFEIPGNDIAGIVESVGNKVRDFQSGDKVFGELSERGFGAFAEYVTVLEKLLAHKPANLSFNEAAAVPEASIVALQAIRDQGEIKFGQKVLINGASGGIGTFSVQIAKYYGAEVTAVCSERNIEMVQTMGADHVIDYTKEDFVKRNEKYDLIVATAGYRSIFDYKRALKPKGIYVATGGSMIQIFQALLLGPLISKSGGKKFGALNFKTNKDLDFIKKLIESGKVNPVIDRIYNFKDAADALRYYGEGHSSGKVVINIADEN